MSEVLDRIFRELDVEGIDYVHFKSNCDLQRSFEAEDDFDILIDRKKFEAAKAVLIRNNGKRFNTIKEKEYPGVDNWLVFDENEGNIYHFHLHCQLCSGKPLLKDYVIPWAEIALRTKVYNECFHIFTTSPEFELCLILFRSSIKARIGNLLKIGLGIYSFSESIDRERLCLLEKVNWDRFNELVALLIDSEDIERFISIARSKELNVRMLRELSRIVRRNIGYSRRFSGLVGTYKSTSRIIKNRIYGICNHILHKHRIVKKTSERGGVILAFVGVDGAGKSTVTKEINNWLKGQLSCFRFYMGSGDGKLPLDVRMLRKLARHEGTKETRAVKGAEDKSIVKASSDKKLSFARRVKDYVSMYIVLRIEKENKKKILQMSRLRNEGAICLLDRYPQIEMPLCNDGPKIIRFGKHLQGNRRYLRALKKEEELLAVVKKVKPNLIFRLNISAQTSMSRKPEQEDISAYQRKIDDLKAISFQHATIIDIDAERDYRSEILEIKKKVWEYI